MERSKIKMGAALLSVSLLTVLLAACSSSTEASGSDQPATGSHAATTASATAIDNTEAAMIAAARRQLEARLGDDAAAISKKAFARVVWPNGAIGCPRPGRSYTMALVPGYQVVLEVDGRLYHYHGREGQAPFYCARPQGQGGWEMDR
ncbi:MAG: hypothetical protein NXH85_17515 [Pseudomonadaceae bacterium]|nr:hypothetical protein [Pseudomonadaceae bacterium]